MFYWYLESGMQSPVLQTHCWQNSGFMEIWGRLPDSPEDATALSLSQEAFCGRKDDINLLHAPHWTMWTVKLVVCKYVLCCTQLPSSYISIQAWHLLLPEWSSSACSTETALGIFALIKGRKDHLRLEEYEFHHRTDGGTVKFTDFKTAKVHQSSVSNAIQAKKAGAGFIAIGVLIFLFSFLT